VARYWHDGGQWNDDAELNFGNGNFNEISTKP
ncbi:nucleoside-specific channel-forming protein Tsx, partial [Escherichia coli]